MGALSQSTANQNKQLVHCQYRWDYNLQPSARKRTSLTARPNPSPLKNEDEYKTKVREPVDVTAKRQLEVILQSHTLVGHLGGRQEDVLGFLGQRLSHLLHALAGREAKVVKETQTCRDTKLSWISERLARSGLTLLEPQSLHQKE
jgi:hypothetical protein